MKTRISYCRSHDYNKCFGLSLGLFCVDGDIICLYIKLVDGGSHNDGLDYV